MTDEKSRTEMFEEALMRLMNMSQDHDTIIRNQEMALAEDRANHEAWRREHEAAAIEDRAWRKEHEAAMSEHRAWLKEHEAMMRENRAMLRDHEQRLIDHSGLMETLAEIMRRLDENLEELRRDSRHTQRLWIRLAQKNGWLDDEDLWDDGDSRAGA